MSRSRNNSHTTINKVLSGTSTLIKATTLPAATALTGVLSYLGKENARAIDTCNHNGDIKNTIKQDFAIESSAVSTMAVGIALLLLLLNTAKALANRQLSAKQALGVSLIVLFAACAMGYSMFKFGVEEQLTAALAAELGAVCALNIGNLLVSSWRHTAQPESETLLPRYNDTVQNRF